MRAGGDQFGILIAERLDNRDVEAKATANLTQEVRAAFPSLAEVEIEAGYDVPYSKLFDQNLLDKLLRRILRKLPGERQLDDGFKAHRSDQPGLERWRCQTKHRLFGIEHRARVRLERQCRDRHGIRLSRLQCRVQYRLVATMHTVEIADRQDAAAQ